ncbi:unnamed protein product [Acanthoscelides obtectus]|uniref:Uncharacterized protein n=1 Tax=Acanthoscelides obtectus TaxID=200917 RepID=A0A9P0Q4V2_ACAOB|nr:unnamed protein product [Acanthoscelides obtectus]CAK1632889.1 hypothetical protein AOBTE_LOCUS7793 [Acanthoscelides obtectus]
MIKQRKRNKKYESSESESDEEESRNSSDDEISEKDENRCQECTENYYKTTSKEDWIPTLLFLDARVLHNVQTAL